MRYTVRSLLEHMWPFATCEFSCVSKSFRRVSGTSLITRTTQVTRLEVAAAVNAALRIEFHVLRVKPASALVRKIDTNKQRSSKGQR